MPNSSSGERRSGRHSFDAGRFLLSGARRAHTVGALRRPAACASLILLAVSTACAPRTPAEDTPPLLPGGYLVRVDSGRSEPGQFVLDQDAQGIHIMTGPGGVAWRPADSVHAGDFRAEAVLTVRDAPVGYREAVGIFVGGRRLDGSDQEYTCLLVRPNGDFQVRRRHGSVTQLLVDWTPHASVQRVVQPGDAPVDTLAVEVSDGEARFLVNGAVVHRASLAEVRPYGSMGIRIDHRLDARLLSWSLDHAPTQPADSTTA
jgi:hypothetical protein